MIFDKYPYTNFHEMNDDWVIQTLREFGQRLDDFVAANSLTYADPIAYDAATTYPANTVIIYDNAAYVSKQATPAGMLPTNDEYWMLIFPFGDLIDQDVNEGMQQIVNMLPSVVGTWMTNHPEITTTVQDGAIDWLKLHNDLKRVLLDGYSESSTINIDDFEQGAIGIENGEDTPSSFMCRTGFITFPKGITLIRTMQNLRIQVFQYALDGTFEYRAITVARIEYMPFVTDENHKYRISISYDDYSTLAPTDLPLIPVVATVYTPDSVMNDELNTSVPVKFRWETGNISSSGNDTGSSNPVRMRTAGYTKINVPSVKLIVPTGYVAIYYIYDDTKAFLNRSNNINSTTVTINITPGYLLRLVVFNTAQTAVSPQEGNKIRVEYGESILDAANDDNYTVYDNASLAMFETMGVLGDSWASGQLYDPRTGELVTTNYAVSWPQIIARKIGADVYNYSSGGLRTTNWLTDSQRGLPKMLLDDPKNLYLINLGINDAKAIANGTELLGTIADVNVEDFTQNPNTFYGNYGRIIGNIIAHAPDAKIICLSIARPGERNIDQDIKAVADIYGVAFVQLTEDRFFTSSLFNAAIVNGHPLAYGYNGMANAIERLLIKCLINNQYYFANYTGMITTP